MFNTVIVLALIAFGIWNLFLSSQLKGQQRDADYRNRRHEAFEVRTICLEYFHAHGRWPSAKDLKEYSEVLTPDMTFVDYHWEIEARYEPIYTKQYLLTLSSVNDPRVRRIFYTGIREAA